MSMKNKQVSVEDFVTIQNLMGKYQWLVDGGDSEGWASLFTEDGLFANGVLEPRKGRAELKKVPAMVLETYGDKMRHLMGSFYVEYGDTTDEAYARYYNLVTTWMKDEGAKIFCMALSTVHLLRIKGEWKIKSNNVNQFSNF